MFSINADIVFFVSLAAWVGYRLLANRKAGFFWPREAVLSLAFLYSWLAFFLTFYPLQIDLFAPVFRGSNLVPLSETLRYLRYLDAPGVKRNLVGNLLLLAPYGIFLPVLSRRYRRLLPVLGSGFLITLAIETSQLMLAMRVFDIDDMILNVLGMAVTYILVSLALLIPGLRRAVDRITNRPQVGTAGYFKAFVAVVILAFLAVLAAGYLMNVRTVDQIVADLPTQGQTLVARVSYGRYFVVLSAGGEGLQEVRFYRQAPGQRFAMLSGATYLDLPENAYAVTGGWQVGEYADYFVIARSSQAVAVMGLAGEQYPVESDGGYHFSVGRLPAASDGRFLDFRFIDAAGNDLGFTEYGSR